jgi:glycosidase
MQGNIYEVNVRQYTPEGTFRAFAGHLKRLKEMGVQTLWFMPIQPISKTDRKGALGSYYAIANYTAVNPEFGTMDDWKSLVQQCHTMGFKVIMDWVANHTGADHYWLEKHPDFYMHDSSTGKPLSPFDWTDTRKLDYRNPALADSMMQCMLYWLKECDIDGFRCDVAGEVPQAFWTKCITNLRKHKDIFMLAEADEPWLHKAGFDASYPWSWYTMCKLIAGAQRPAFALDSVMHKMDSTYPPGYLKMYFTSNHDENSWNKADYGTMPGASHAPFAVLTQTLPHGVPLIYSGQEEPVTDSISFFYKDTIHFGKYARAPFYRTLLELRKNNAALSADAAMRRVQVGDSTALYAFVREKQGNKILVIANLSAKPQAITVKETGLQGEPYNVFMGTKEPLKGTPWEIEPWGYVIYTY